MRNRIVIHLKTYLFEKTEMAKNGYVIKQKKLCFLFRLYIFVSDRFNNRSFPLSSTKGRKRVASSAQMTTLLVSVKTIKILPMKKHLILVIFSLIGGSLFAQPLDKEAAESAKEQVIAE